MKVPIAVIILTKNEALDLPLCLESLKWCDDVHVVDSGSEDFTRNIALEFGASVVVNPFQSFGQQRNWALDHCDLKYDWVLFLDADERTTPEMVDAMQLAISHADAEVAGYYCCWKLLLDGKWLKRSDNFPKWQFRLLRHGCAWFTDFGHGQKEGNVQGRIEYLHEPYLHSPFNRGWSHWEKKHIRYARHEAIARSQTPFFIRNLFSKHASQRNPALKILLTRLPAWPSLRFIFTYFLQGGFLEGREGLEYCKRMRWFEQQVQANLKNPDISKAATSALDESMS